jgi:hypothetical protein
MKPASFLPAIFLAVTGLAQQPSAVTAQYTPPNQGQNQGFAVGGISQCTTDPSTKKVSCTAVASSQQPVIHACPIAMRARQGGGGLILRTDKDERDPSQPSMNPRLALSNPKGQRIVSAAITAHGYGANNGTTLLDTGDAVLRSTPNPQRLRLVRTLTARFMPDDDNTVIADLRLPGFVVLESIELNSITLSDGSIQNFSSDSGCRVQPDLIMLVSGK